MPKAHISGQGNSLLERKKHHTGSPGQSCPSVLALCTDRPDLPHLSNKAQGFLPPSRCQCIPANPISILPSAQTVCDHHLCQEDPSGPLGKQPGLFHSVHKPGLRLDHTQGGMLKWICRSSGMAHSTQTCMYRDNSATCVLICAPNTKHTETHMPHWAHAAAHATYPHTHTHRWVPVMLTHYRKYAEICLPLL